MIDRQGRRGLPARPGRYRFLLDFITRAIFPQPEWYTASTRASYEQVQTGYERDTNKVRPRSPRADATNCYKTRSCTLAVTDPRRSSASCRRCSTGCWRRPGIDQPRPLTINAATEPARSSAGCERYFSIQLQDRQAALTGGGACVNVGWDPVTPLLTAQRFPPRRTPMRIRKHPYYSWSYPCSEP